MAKVLATTEQNNINLKGMPFPFSGVFWNNINDTSWDKIDIYMDGYVRNPDIKIVVANQTVINRENCSDDNEWAPTAKSGQLFIYNITKTYYWG
ncbi:MAG: hypothetical protein K6E47_11720 [Lachnospiraceae bacterium]|nr:hypothetical protein [Lachnospiraceae bacterium]